MEVQKTRFGFSDEELKALPTVYRADLFSGKTVVVSGGGSGFGKAIACLLARLGANVAICGRNEEKLAATVSLLESMGAQVFSRSLTIRDPDQVDGFIEAVWDKFGALDLLVNNAGGQFPQMALDFKVKGWNAVIDTNLNGTWYMMQSAARQWVERKTPGSIVNIIADIWRGMPGIAHTCAARAGVAYLSKSVAVEWAPHPSASTASHRASAKRAVLRNIHPKVSRPILAQIRCCMSATPTTSPRLLPISPRRAPSSLPARY